MNLTAIGLPSPLIGRWVDRPSPARDSAEILALDHHDPTAVFRRRWNHVL